ncbi:dipeptidyl aminopeptidase-like protein 6 [Oppia nitens]|uniref:dipeptidyl aminopeptidase-like protein 6 n=1 Tax=Oppia nitens TaxID=1686743 RepID=UPI0023DC3FC9|nr:dipeptidyl aminopeptidase-like protein 6 [Oppia nitens]
MKEFEEKELVVNEVEQRNWKGILISLLVIASICSLILLSIFLLSPHFGANDKSHRLSLDDFLISGYKHKEYNGSWISDRELLYYNNNNTFYTYNIDTKYRRVLVDGIHLRTNGINVKKFSISADRRFLLIASDIKKTGSLSYLAKYVIYDTKSNAVVQLLMPDSSDYIQHASWSPNANQLLVIHKNNIYLYFRVGDQPIQITSNGREGFIFNGVPDLMYEEHILETNLAFWWFNDGSRLCYASFDNTLVDQMPYIIYGDINSTNHFKSNDNENLRISNYPYPKPGREISKVTLTVVDISAPNYVRTRTQILPPDELRGLDYYMTAPIAWITKTSIAVIWSRRTQNYTIVSICKEENNWVCNKIIDEQVIGRLGWLIVNKQPIISDNGKYIFIQLPVADGIYGTFDHIAMIYTESGKKYFLTHGQFVVTKILTYRSDLNKIYFIATIYNQPGIRHIFSVTDMNSKIPRVIDCLSCNRSEKCWFNNAVFSPNGRYYLSECLGPDIPSVYLMSVDDNKFIETLDNNEELQNIFKLISLPKMKYMTIPNGKGFNIRVELILPQTLDENEDTKYPAVIEINNRPDGQSVNYEHKLDWSRYLVSHKDYVAIHIDGTGTGFQGNKFMFDIMPELGKLEVQDLLFAINYLKKSVSYIDEDKIVVWGREYGGFLTVSLLAAESEKKNPSITCAIAVSPITNFKNYFSVFSERYIGFPYANGIDTIYQKTDLTRMSDMSTKFKGKTFLLVHGTADKRVNIHHSMLLMKSLTENSVQFKVQLYPDSDLIESWDQSVRRHFYLTMEDFFAKCFQVEDEEEESIISLTSVFKKGVQKP